MDGSFVESLVEHSRYRVPTVLDGRVFVPVGWSRALDPLPEPILVGTLQGLVDYAKANRDQLELSKVVAHVVGPDRVDLAGAVYSPPADHRRIVACAADRELVKTRPMCPLNAFADAETFVIHLLANFEHDLDHEHVLGVVSSLREERVKETDDDSYSQTVTARDGIVSVASVSVKNPVNLRPHRTFAEVTQPASPFILRFRGGGQGQKPAVGLFEADNGAWRLEAIGRIREWLSSRLPEVVVVLA
jgi:hypothetical protein